MPNMKRFVLLSRIPGYGGTRYAVLGDDLDACADCEFAARPLLGGSSITLVAFDHSDLPSAAFQLTGTDSCLHRLEHVSSILCRNPTLFLGSKSRH